MSEEKVTYFKSVDIMSPEKGAYCSCCGKLVDKVRMFIKEKPNGSDNNYISLCRDCHEAIVGVYFVEEVFGNDELPNWDQYKSLFESGHSSSVNY